MTIAEWIAVTLLGPSILGILGWLFSSRMADRKDFALREKEAAVLASEVQYLREDLLYIRKRLNGLLKED